MFCESTKKWGFEAQKQPTLTLLSQNTITEVHGFSFSLAEKNLHSHTKMNTYMPHFGMYNTN